MQYKSVALLTFLILSLVAASTLQAKPNKPVPSAKTPVIEQAQVILEDELNCPSEPESVDTLTIMGTGLVASDGAEPVVTLGLLPPLIVCNFAEDYVVAMLPSATEDGNYLLSVIMVDGVGTFDLTIGAIGPQGVQGPVGPQGPVGADGEQGTDGEDGADGAEGPVGPQGPVGADGEQGTDGEDGADGAEGPVGPRGPAGNDGTQGPVGPAGVDGTNGIDGVDGPQGEQGPQGSAGVSNSGTIQSGVCDSVGVTGGNTRFCTVDFPTSFSTNPVCVATSSNGVWSASIIPSETTIYYVSILFYRNPDDGAFENVKASWICHSS